MVLVNLAVLRSTLHKIAHRHQLTKEQRKARKRIKREPIIRDLIKDLRADFFNGGSKSGPCKKIDISEYEG